MIKTLAKQIKEYKSASLVTPIFMILSDCSPVSWVVNTVRKHPPVLPEI